MIGCGFHTTNIFFFGIYLAPSIKNNLMIDLEFLIFYDIRHMAIGIK
jgi:hypothetical protein